MCMGWLTAVLEKKKCVHEKLLWFTSLDKWLKSLIEFANKWLFLSEAQKHLRMIKAYSSAGSCVKILVEKESANFESICI